MSQVVVVTGATAGVGRATSRALALRGDRVALLARGADGLDATLQDIEAAGAVGLAVPVDVADEESVRAAADHVERELGPIDVWINNAMTSVFAEFVDISPDEFRRVTEVTYLGYVWGTRAALQRMLPRDRGVIVQVGSALMYRSIPLQSAYCGAKHAVGGFTQSVRTELLHRRSGVQLAVVQLPGLNTPHFRWALSRLPNDARPVAPIYQPEVATRAVLAAVDHPKREIWVGGSTVATLLANKVAAGLLDRYLAWRGYAAQQTDQRHDADHPTNLWKPTPGDHGAHGDFGASAKGSSLVSGALRLTLPRRR